MKITKELKYFTFVYDEETKEFTIKSTPHGTLESGYAIGGNSIKLNKVYAFAFMRFVIRMAQRNWLKQAKKENKELDIVDEFMVELEVEQENPNQLEMFVE